MFKMSKLCLYVSYVINEFPSGFLSLYLYNIIHMYAYDTQLYITFEHGQSDIQVVLLEECLEDIKDWMKINFLKLNDDKT